MSCSSLVFDRVVCRASWVGLLGLLAVAGCERRSYENAAGGALPPMVIPVGPPPGPAPPTAPVANPYGDDRVTLLEGRTLFARFNCGGCHGDHGGGGMGPSLRDDRWRYGQSPEDVFGSIAQGRGQGMPAWGLKIPNSQIWKLVGYIHSFRTDREPEAPIQAIPPPPL